MAGGLTRPEERLTQTDLWTLVAAWRPARTTDSGVAGNAGRGCGNNGGVREDRNQASVRIEIDGDVGAPSSVPAAASGSSRLPLLGGLVALALAAVLVLLALPDIGDGTVGDPETAAESDAQPPTTTTTLEPVDDQLRITGDDLELPPTTAGEPSALRPTSLGMEVQSIAPASRGWISLRGSNGGTGEPRLGRSLDGIEWTVIDTSFDLPDLDVTYAEYSNLVATETGFAMLMTSFSDVTDPDGEQTSVLHRLVSEFGATWEIDPDFTPWKSTGEFAQPVAHVGDWVQMVLGREPSVGSSPVMQVLLSTVIDPGALGDICWAYSSGATRLTVENCQGPNSSVQLQAEDFLEPDRFEEIRACVEHLVNSGPTPGMFEFVTIGRNGEVRDIDDVAVLVSAPTILADGTVVMVDGGKELFEIGSCEDLVDLELRDGSRLVYWPAGAEQPNHISVDLYEIPDFSFFGVGGAATIPNGLRVVIGREVWEVDLVESTLERLIELPDVGSGSSPRVSVLTPDGSRVVSFSPEAEFTVYDFATGERSVLEDDLGSVGWIEPLHVTNDEVLFRIFGVQSRTVWLDLTPQ